MSSTLFILIVVFGSFLCLFTLIVVGLAYTATRGLSKGREAWKQFAEKNGLTFQQSSPLGYGLVTGQYQGRTINLQAYTSTGTQRSRHTWTVVSLTVNNPKDISLSIKANAGISEIEKGFGGQGSSISIEEFFHKFVVQSNPPGLAESMLRNDPLLRNRILEATPSELEYKDQNARYESLGLQLDPDQLEKMFRLISDFADAVEKG